MQHHLQNAATQNQQKVTYFVVRYSLQKLGSKTNWQYYRKLIVMLPLPVVCLRLWVRIFTFISAERIISMNLITISHCQVHTKLLTLRRSSLVQGQGQPAMAIEILWNHWRHGRRSIRDRGDTSPPKVRVMGGRQWLRPPKLSYVFALLGGFCHFTAIILIA